VVSVSSFSKRFPVTVLLVAISFLGAAHATTIEGRTWPELVESADFVGIAECTVAGVLVATYKIVDTWMGEAPEGEVNIFEPPDFYGPSFPTALVGQRWIVIANKARMDHVGGKGWGMPDTVPLWQRRLPVDYTVPLFEGRWPTSTAEDGGVAFAWESYEFEDIEANVKEYAALPRDERIAIALASRVQMFIDRYDEVSDLFHEKYTMQEIRALLHEYPRLPEIQNAVLEVARAAQPRAVTVLQLAVVAFPFPESEPFLRRLLQNPGPFDKQEVEFNLERVMRIKNPHPRKPVTDRPTRRTFEGGVEAARAQLNQEITKDASTGKLWDAFFYLCQEDPDYLAEWLREWTNPELEGRERRLGYNLGSIFGIHCETNRERNFKRLLNADDPYIRVAGAIYLAYEDESAGINALQELTNLDGDPGTWAALNLARRGMKEHVPRMLEAFAPGADSWDIRHLLAARAEILLSNSAAYSEVPQPKPTKQLDGRMATNYAAWWLRHDDEIVLHESLVRDARRAKR